MKDKALPKSGRIGVEIEKCHQCGICELVCSLYHDGVCGPSVSRISLLRDPFTGEARVETCRQCLYPDCYFVCPVQAIVIEEKTGARVILEEKCTGCGKCAKACPFSSSHTILKHDEKKKFYFKCDLCYERDEGPICVEACPWNALKIVSGKKSRKGVEMRKGK